MDENSGRLELLEKQIDEEYAKCVPGLGCWEADAVHLLMAHECASLGSEPRLHADLSKYDLMHAIRWAACGTSHAGWKIPSRLSIEAIDRSRSCLARAREYVTFCGACWKAFNRFISVEFPTDTEVVFGRNAEWLAFDVLDLRLNDGSVDRSARDRLLFSLRKAARRTEILRHSRVESQELYAPDLQSLRLGVAHLASGCRQSEILPSAWAFRAVPIDSFRKFWHALRAIALLHLAVITEAIPVPALPGARLLALPRSALIPWICELTDLPSDMASEVLAYHIFDHEGKQPDISLTPFISLGAEQVVTSPSLLSTLNFERNFCALLTQTSSDEFAASTRQCAFEMAADLRDRFHDRGFLAETGIDIGSTDIDLLVWSPEEGFLLSCELRWLVPTADVAEVFNRGQRTSLGKMETQLPKHELELKSNAESLVQRIFGQEYSAPVRHSRSMLVLRGFVGSPGLRTAGFAFCDDRLLLQQLKTGCPLSALFEWCERMPYLPQAGKDFDIEASQIVSPSGARITHHETAFAEIPV